MVDGVSLESMAEYKRKDETECLVPEKSLLPELTNKSEVASRRCLYVNWVIPDPENNRGALLGIDKFVVRIENAGVYDVNMVVQQPHGHESCPSSVAAWVMLANSTLKAGGSVVHHIRPVDNNFIVPYRQDVQGVDTVCFMVFSVARQAQYSGGSDMSPSEVGLRLTIEAHYRAAGSSVDNGKFFTITTLADDTSMFVVDSKPPTAISVRDVAPGCAGLNWVLSGSAINPAFVAAGSVQPIETSKLTGLSTNHTYRLPYPVIAKRAVGMYLRFLESKWQVTEKPDSAQALLIGDVPAEKLGSYTGDCLLTPVPKYVYTARVKCLKSGSLSGRLVRATVRPHGSHGLAMVGADWRTDLLKAVSFVVSVIKVAAAVAGAAGLLNVLEDDPEFDYVSC